jgi:T-complex protein 1 subunit zeta
VLLLLLYLFEYSNTHTYLYQCDFEQMSKAVVDAIECIHEPDKPSDLTRVEILSLQRQLALDSRLIKGLVLDHGGRHPDMPSELKNVYILTCNLSLEYEQTETNATFVYSNADERQKLVESERVWLDERCRTIVNFKRSVCTNGETFCIINQKGVDPLSLDIFAKEGILCLRRAKRRNLDRLVLACGGQIVLSLEDLQKEYLGQAGSVMQVTYGEDKYTFVQDCPQAHSCTLLLQGPNTWTVEQLKDAVKDGLRAVKNAVEDQAVCPGGGAFEMAASRMLATKKSDSKAYFGIQAYSKALLCVPKTLALNAGLDVPDTLRQWQQQLEENEGTPLGLNVYTGECMIPSQLGVYDNVRVKRQSLHLATILANQLLLVDEVMRAGKRMGQAPGGPGGDDE